MGKKSLKKNAILNCVKQACSILFPLITFPYISRILGKEGYGIYSFSASIASYFILIAGLGVNTYAIREGAKIRENKKEISNFCSEIFTINIFSLVLSIFLLICTVAVSKKLQGYLPFILANCINMILVTIGTDWVNNIYEDFAYITYRYLAMQLIAVGLMFLFVRNSDDILQYALISVFATSGGNLVNLFYVKRYVNIRIRLKNLSQHLFPIIIIFFNSVAITIYVQSDITMLGYYTNDATVGIYSFASKIYNLLKQLINAIIIVAIPRICYIVENEENNYIPELKKIVKYLNLLLIPTVIGMFMMCKHILFIAGGEQYLSGALELKILSIATIFALYSSVFTNCVLIVNKREKQCLYATIISAIINIGLNFALLPKLKGEGAALTTVIAEFINCIVQFYFCKEVVEKKWINFVESKGIFLGGIFILLICLASVRIFNNIYIQFVVAVAVSCTIYLFIVCKFGYINIRKMIEIIYKRV